MRLLFAFMSLIAIPLCLFCIAIFGSFAVIGFESNVVIGLYFTILLLSPISALALWCFATYSLIRDCA